MGFYKRKETAPPIEAVLWTGENLEEVDAFMGGIHTFEEARVVIVTLEGTMYGDPGDWIIKGVKGEFYPCKPDIFDELYEPARGQPSRSAMGRFRAGSEPPDGA